MPHADQARPENPPEPRQPGGPGDLNCPRLRAVPTDRMAMRPVQHGEHMGTEVAGSAPNLSSLRLQDELGQMASRLTGHKKQSPSFKVTDVKKKVTAGRGGRAVSSPSTWLFP